MYRLLRSKEGFTFGEVLIAVILLALLIPLFIIFVDGMRHVGMSKTINRATQLAQEKMEELGSAEWNNLSSGGPETHGNFDLSWQVANNIDIDGDGSPDNDVKQITVTVTWEEGKRETSLVTRRYRE